MKGLGRREGVGGLGRCVYEFVVSEPALVLLEIEPDTSIPTVFAGWHAVSGSWNDKYFLKPWEWEVVRIKPVASMKTKILTTKDFKSESKVNQYFREFQLVKFSPRA
jgi:hypothetical protein